MAEKSNPKKFLYFKRSPLLAEAFNMFLSNLAGLFVYWVGYSIFDAPGNLAYSFGWFIFVLASILCVLTTNERKPIKQAWLYHLVVSLGYGFAIGLPLVTVTVLLPDNFGIWLLALVLFIVRLVYVIVGLQVNRSENAKTGRLVSDGSKWNLQRSLIVWSFETNERWIQFWKYAQPLGPLAGAWAMNTLSSMGVGWKIIVGGGLYSLVCMALMLTVSTHLGIAIQLVIWGWQGKEDIRLV